MYGMSELLNLASVEGIESRTVRAMDDTGCMKHCRKPYLLFSVHRNAECFTLRLHPAGLWMEEHNVHKALLELHMMPLIRHQSRSLTVVLSL